MAKIIIDDSELIDAHAMQTLEKLASFFTRIDDPYRMPTQMSEILAREYPGVDQYYAVPVGYGPLAMQLRMTFKKGLMIMEFSSPDGTRLMELRLHE